MWFLLSLLALSMLVARRSAEKHVAGNVSSLALAWLQQAAALPFIIAALFFAKFYWPAELSVEYWWTMATYVVLVSMDVYFYFKALSIADISYVAPLMTLTSIGNIVGAYFVLGQVPTLYGAIGAVMIVAGGILDVFKYKWLLTFIGLTYTVNMLATYQAKLIGPNAGYVATVKSASVLPVMLVGLFLFKEKIIKPQWVGLGLIVVGLVLLAFNH
jgi:drug/metabolite transporter (DMT)-like permease